MKAPISRYTVKKKSRDALSKSRSVLRNTRAPLQRKSSSAAIPSHSRTGKRGLGNNEIEAYLEATAQGKLRMRAGYVYSVPARAGKTMLRLDYDHCNTFSKTALTRRSRLAGVRILRIRSRRSPSLTGWHVLVFLQGHFRPMERIALQAILSSDPAREALNFRRVKALGEKAAIKWEGKLWNVLFQKPKNQRISSH